MREPGGARFEHEAGTTRGTRQGFAGLVTEVQQETYRKLAWLALVVAGVVGGRLVMGLLSSRLALPGPAQWLAYALVAVVSVGFALLCRRGGLSPSRFPTLALGYEVLVSLGLGTIVLDWQNKLGEGGWLFGAFPAVAVWVILFASVVPLSPLLHLLGGLLSSAGLAFWFFASLSLYEVPPTVGPGENLRVFLQLMAAMAAGVAVGYLCADRVYRLSLDLSRARRLGSYVLTEKLGQGGMGEVWRARHVLLARPAAVKLIRGATAGPWEIPGEVLQRFEREVQATATLRSPHTVEIYDYGTGKDGTFYYVMELLDGIDLEKLVKRHGPQPAGRVVHILRQACHSLGEAHAEDLVHRDVKPANIYLCRYGRDLDFVKVLDFGLVKGQRGDDGRLTQVGSFVGTPQYASPEMAAGLVERADGRSDVYSLGVVAFWLLTGRPLFEGETAMQVLMKHVNAEPEAPSRHASETPPELDELILACLKKDPGERIASMDELDAGLATIGRSHPWSTESAGAWWESCGEPGTMKEGGQGGLASGCGTDGQGVFDEDRETRLRDPDARSR